MKNFIPLFLISYGSYYLFNNLLNKPKKSKKSTWPANFKENLNIEHKYDQNDWYLVTKIPTDPNYYGEKIIYQNPEYVKKIVLSLQESLGKDYNCTNLDFSNTKDNKQVVDAIAKAIHSNYPMFKNIPPQKYINNEFNFKYTTDQAAQIKYLYEEFSLWHFARMIFYHFICGVPSNELYL